MTDIFPSRADVLFPIALRRDSSFDQIRPVIRTISEATRRRLEVLLTQHKRTWLSAMRSRPTSRGGKEPVPAIAEIVRTRVHPPSLTLRVEKIVETILWKNLLDDKSSGAQNPEYGQKAASKAQRLLLSDGELMIQAVLHESLQYCLHAGEVTEGCLLELIRYKVLRAPRLHGKGQVVYFAIDDLEVVGATRPPTREMEVGGGFIRESHLDLSQDERVRKRRKVGTGEDGAAEERIVTAENDKMVVPPSSQDTDSDGFESASAPVEEVERRRRTLKDLESNLKTAQTPQPTKRTPSKIDGAEVVYSRQANQPSLVNQVPTGSQLQNPGPNPPKHPHSASSAELQIFVTPTTPAQSPPRAEPPLHTLSSLLHPPPSHPLPSRNYHCRILCTISWISPSLIHKPASPFPPKRHVKIHDPSISHRHTGVTVAVFRDARNFKPVVGTVALLRDLTMQRWQGEVILNKYAAGLASAAPGVGVGGGDDTGSRARAAEDASGGRQSGGGDAEQEEWFIDDPVRLRRMGFDVEGMRNWWAEREAGKVT